MKAFLAILLAPAALLGQSSSLLIEDLTWTEVRDAIASGKTTAIYYAASVEENGPGVALGKHIFIARHTAQKIAEELGDALVYPVMPFAPLPVAPAPDRMQLTGLMRYPGSIHVSEQAFGLIAHDVALSAIAAGFQNVLLIGDHGGDGQHALERVAAALDRAWKSRGVRVVHILDPYAKEKEAAAAYLTERGLPLDCHAGIDDTSEVMFIDQEQKWIRPNKLAVGPGPVRAIFFGRGPLDSDETGVCGDQTKATPELGKVFLDFKVKFAVEQIRQVLQED